MREQNRDFANHLFPAQSIFVTENLINVQRCPPGYLENTGPLATQGVRKATVTLRCMHVPDLSYSKGEAKRSQSAPPARDKNGGEDARP